MKFALFLMFLNAFGGDTVIQNGRTPKGPAQTLEFKQELALNPDSGEDHHSWSSDRVTFLVGKQGQIYIMDGGGFRILLLDKDGKLIKSAGRKGDGPNEFLFLSNISIQDDGSLFVFEQRGGASVFTRFDKDLNQIERNKHQNLGGKFVPCLIQSPNKQFYQASWQESTPEFNTVYHGIMDKDFNILTTVMTHKFKGFDGTKFSDVSWRTEFLANILAAAPNGQGIVTLNGKGGFYSANTNKYEITEWDANLKKVRVITRDAKPIIQTPEEIASLTEIIRDEVLTNTPESMHSAYPPALVSAAIEKAGFQARKPPLFGVIPMGDSILAINDYQSTTGDIKMDIFDPKGEFIGTTSMKHVNFHFYGYYFGYFANLRFANGKAYALLDTEDGDYQLVRYSYKLKPAK